MSREPDFCLVIILSTGDWEIYLFYWAHGYPCKTKVLLTRKGRLAVGEATSRVSKARLEESQLGVQIHISNRLGGLLST